jgi:transposase
MMGRYDLTDAHFALIEPELPSNDGKTGHPWNPHRPIINGIFWRLHTGAPWPDIPERYGKWQTIYDRYTWWRRDGTWERILKALQLKLDAQGAIDWEQWALDGTVVRAHRVAAGAPHDGRDRADEPPDHALGRSVGGFSTKIHLLSDGNGLPLDARLTPGQTQESTQAEIVMEQVALPRASGRVRRRPRRLAADRGYDAQRIRHWLRSHGIKPIIPPRRRKGKRKRGRPVSYDRVLYRRRSTIEQCVGWLKECRAVATRYEKLALNYLGLVKLAFIERYLRLLTRAPMTAVS